MKTLLSGNAVDRLYLRREEGDDLLLDILHPDRPGGIPSGGHPVDSVHELKDPAHRGTAGRLLLLVREGSLQLLERTPNSISHS